MGQLRSKGQLSRFSLHKESPQLGIVPDLEEHLGGQCQRHLLLVIRGPTDTSSIALIALHRVDRVRFLSWPSANYPQDACRCCSWYRSVLMVEFKSLIGTCRVKRLRSLAYEGAITPPRSLPATYWLKYNQVRSFR